jgi:hypothetical protein
MVVFPGTDPAADQNVVADRDCMAHRLQIAWRQRADPREVVRDEQPALNNPDRERCSDSMF